MSSPWSQIVKVEPVNLLDVMSEQIAHNLQEREDRLFGQQLAEQCVISSTLKNDPATAKSELFVDHQTPAESENCQDLDDAVNVGASGSTSANDVFDNVRNTVGFDLDEFCDSDRVIAEMLQAEFDRAHDLELKLYEKHQNKDSKVSVSLSQYRKLPDDMLDDSDEDDGPDERKHWDRFEQNEKIMGGMSKKGFAYDADGIKVI